MSIQFITLKKKLNYILPIDIIDIIKSYDDSHISKKLRYDINVNVLYKDYKLLSINEFTFCLKEQFRAMDITKHNDNIELTIFTILHTLNIVYIYFSNVKLPQRFKKLEKTVIERINILSKENEIIKYRKNDIIILKSLIDNVKVKYC